MTVIEFAERLIEDPSLTSIYGNFDVDSLAGLLHDTLRVALFETAEDGSRAKQEAKLFLHHFRLFQLGLNGNHFQVIKDHFREALLHSWVDEAIVEEAVSYLDSLWPLFRDHDGASSTNSHSGTKERKTSDREGANETVALAQLDVLLKKIMVPRTA